MNTHLTQMNIIDRETARLAGQSLYFTGTLCKNGHLSQRRVSNKQCIACWQLWHDTHKAHHRATMQRHYKENKATYIEKSKEWRLTNPERDREIKRDWNRNNPETGKAWVDANRDKHNVSVKKWKASNPDKVYEYTGTRRASKLQATPSWADRREIQKIYAKARRITKHTGIAHHVDHVIPLQGDIVSGLHVPANLQILPETTNCQKGTSFDQETISQAYLLSLLTSS